MINPKKNKTLLFRFVLFLAFTATVSCHTGKPYNNRIEGKKIAITGELAANQEIEYFIKPYREHIDNDLDSVLAYSPETLDKSKTIDKWQTAIGNLMADVTMEYAEKLFYTRQKKHIDLCFLNHGGIRAVIPKGNITARTAYEVMPFENSLIIVALKGEQLRELADYIAQEKKPHPLAGMQIVMDTEGAVKKITVMGIPVNNQRVYYVATSDYLAGGGDNMAFFKKAATSYDMDYKLRNLYIDYFKDTDTIQAFKNPRITVE